MLSIQRILLLLAHPPEIKTMYSSHSSYCDIMGADTTDITINTGDSHRGIGSSMGISKESYPHETKTPEIMEHWRYFCVFRHGSIKWIWWHATLLIIISSPVSLLKYWWFTHLKYFTKLQNQTNRINWLFHFQSQM